MPWNEPGIVGKVLDGGAYGVICPMVNTRGEAQALVSYCRYPPTGQRSNGPILAREMPGRGFSKLNRGRKVDIAIASVDPGTRERPLALRLTPDRQGTYLVDH